MIGIVTLTASDPSASDRPSPRCESSRGSFAFHYAARLSPEERTWLARFRIAVPGNILPSEQIVELKRMRARLFVYDWITGFYLDAKSGAQDGSWESFLYYSKPNWLLNPDRPHAGPDGTGRAYYYDPFHPDLQRAWAERLAGMLERSSYDGVFFDLVGSLSVPEDLRQIYATRHPDTPYDEALRGFLRALRQVRPGALIFTNQGYRTPGAYLPLADYDLSESLMTSYVWGEPIKVFVDGKAMTEARETFYRPWEELREIVDSIQEDARRHNPRVKIFHLNYVNPRYRPTGRTQIVDGTAYPVFRKTLDRQAIYYGYVAAKLWGHESYSPSEKIGFSREGIYFVDLGKPLGERWEEHDGLVRRYYEKGIVVLNPSDAPRMTRLASPFVPPGVRDLWDCYEGKTVGGLTVTVEPTVSQASDRRYPAGRVYLHLR